MNVKQIAQLTLKNVIAPESRPTQSDCSFRTKRRLGITRETLYAASSANIAQFFFPKPMFSNNEVTNETEMKILPSSYQQQPLAC